MTQNEAAKLVSKDLLKKFGDKSKRIFRSSVSSESTGSTFYIELTKEVSIAENFLLEINILGYTSKDLNAKVVADYHHDEDTMYLYGILYGPAVIDKFIVLENDSSEVLFAVQLLEAYQYVKVDVVDLNDENVNIGQVTNSISVSVLEDWELTSFARPFEETETTFSIADSDDSLQTYPDITVFNLIKEARQAKCLSQNRDIKLNGLVEESTQSFNGSQDITFTLKMAEVDPQNCTQYNAVLIDNTTGAVKGINLPSLNYVITGYPTRTSTIIPLEADSKNRGYVVIPGGGASDIHHEDLTLLNPLDYVGEIIQHTGAISEQFVNGYFYKAISTCEYQSTINNASGCESSNFSFDPQFDSISFINAFKAVNNDKWNTPQGELINFKFPVTLEILPVIAIPEESKGIPPYIAMFRIMTNDNKNDLLVSKSIFDETFNIQYDEENVLKHLSTMTLAILTLDEVGEAAWNRIDVQPQTEIQSIDNEFIDNLN